MQGSGCIIHLNIALQMVVSLYSCGKDHVSNGQNVSFKVERVLQQRLKRFIFGSSDWFLAELRPVSRKRSLCLWWKKGAPVLERPREENPLTHMGCCMGAIQPGLFMGTLRAPAQVLNRNNLPGTPNLPNPTADCYHQLPLWQVTNLKRLCKKERRSQAGCL